MKKLFFILLAVIVIACGSSPEAPEQNQDFVKTQVSQTVIASFELTSAAQVPTEIPPTEIPPTETPQINTDVMDYLTNASSMAYLCADNTGILGAYFSDMSKDISLFYDTTYMSELNNLIDELVVYCTNFHQDNPPESLIAINDILRGVDDDYLQAAFYLKTGLSTLDVDKLNTATDYILSATDKMGEATTLIEALYP